MHDDHMGKRGSEYYTRLAGDVKAPETTSANDRQTAGEHYKAAFQHWDWVAAVGLAYRPGNASKYIARWRKKNGYEDLEKALHYLDKELEGPQPPAVASPSGYSAPIQETVTFAVANDLTAKEFEILLHLAFGDFESARHKLRQLMEEVNRGTDAIMSEMRRT